MARLIVASETFTTQSLPQKLGSIAPRASGGWGSLSGARGKPLLQRGSLDRGAARKSALARNIAGLAAALEPVLDGEGTETEKVLATYSPGVLAGVDGDGQYPDPKVLRVRFHA